MINSFAILSLIASVALAQQVPSGLSSKCEAFYKSMSDDSALSACTSALTKSTSGFAPGASSSGTSVSAALTSLCSDTTCSEAVVRKTVATFATECPAELASNDQVKALYESLYILPPLRESICTKNEEGEWCLTSVGKNVDAGTKSDVQKYMSIKDNSAANFTTFSSSNSAFLFTNPDWPQPTLCTRCTHDILTAYIRWQSNTPTVLQDSQLLAGETKLYEAVTNTCGSDFLAGTVKAAGGISSGIGSSSNDAPSLLSNAKAVALAVLGATFLTVL